MSSFSDFIEDDEMEFLLSDYFQERNANNLF